MGRAVTDHDREYYLERSREEAKRAIDAPDPVSHRRCVELSQRYARLAQRVADDKAAESDTGSAEAPSAATSASAPLGAIKGRTHQNGGGEQDAGNKGSDG